MRFNLILGLLPLLFIIGSAEIQDFDSDTIEITALIEPDGIRPKNRNLPPFLPPLPPIPALVPVPQINKDEVVDNASIRAKISLPCNTARNEEGVCKPFKECYPLFFLRDLEEGRRRKREVIPALQEGSYLELEKIYRNVSGPCDKDVLDAIASIDIGKGVATPMEEYVCCPNDKKKPASQPSRPPASTTTTTTTTRTTMKPEVGDINPPPSGGGGGNHFCGKSFVSYKSSEEEGGGNNATDSDGIAVSRIVNGRRAAKGEYPWAVALMNNGVQFCGGSLISESHVLTAAHCIYYMNQNDVTKLRLYIGDHDVYSNSDGVHEERKASNIYFHRGFSMSTLFDDISVIRLERPVKFGKYIQPVCLHNGESPPYDTGTTAAEVVGWGQVANKGPPSNILNTVQVRVIPQLDCIKAYGKKAPAGIGRGMVCAGGSGRDSCRGDSGGPLTINSGSQAKQIGVVSWGIGCATFPGVYTRIDRYSAWISKNQR